MNIFYIITIIKYLNLYIYNTIITIIIKIIEFTFEYATQRNAINK